MEVENKKESETCVELKQLPKNLKYVFLDSKKNCLAIMSFGLKEPEENKLVQVLKKHNRVM